jgi:hypothetical protein
MVYFAINEMQLMAALCEGITVASYNLWEAEYF